MKNKLFIKLSVAFMLACAAFFVCQGVTEAAQRGKISGIVKDAETGEALPGVNVVVVGTTLGAATALDGHYFIINIPPGTYSVRASFIGYAGVRKTDVRVNVDHTTPLNFDLKVTAIVGEEVTVVAEREIIKLDVSSSQIVAEVELIKEVPLVTEIFEFANLQAGIENDMIRGGTLDQVSFLIDGLALVDNSGNEPLMMVNLSSVAELNIITGGFNAEYGNIRSGLINVVTKEGSRSRYHGSIDFRITPARRKHDGPALTDPMNFYLRPYLDPEVMWEGTANGGWDEETQAQFPNFVGWDAVSAQSLADTDPSNDRTPEQARDLFLWQHGAEGSAALGQKELKYSDKPDWIGEASLGGPVPFIGKSLGNLSFFASYRQDREMFGLPTSRDYFTQQNANFKLTSRLSPNMKLTLEGLFGDIETVSFVHGGDQNSYLRSGDDIFNTALAAASAFGARDGGQLFMPSTLTPFDITRRMEGIAFDHVLSDKTFYNVRISHVRIENSAAGPDFFKSDDVLATFGNFEVVGETPFGMDTLNFVQMQDGMIKGAVGAWVRDASVVNTYHAKFDLTSQINRYNQIKAGLEFNYDDLDLDYGTREWLWEDSEIKTQVSPYRLGGYVQDKLEFGGMIANFGVRFDYNNPNTDWFTVDRFSKFFGRGFADTFTEVTPQEAADSHVRLSPRLGISHPITDKAKLYFNYGHFYSMPISDDMFRIAIFGQAALRRIDEIGNPSADIPRTIAYELGVEYNVGDLFLLGLAGYYKDVTNQTGSVQYTNIDASVDYFTIENNHYEDIRGFELRIDRRFGKWITGWLNYNYQKATNGFIGREHYFEDQRLQRLEGLQNPVQEIPIARPFARANLNIRSPNDFGPTIAGIKPLAGVRLNFLYSYKSGQHFTWDPLRTFQLRDNVQWNSEHNVDARLSRSIRLGIHNLTLFAEVRNLFDNQYIALARGEFDRAQAFRDDRDFQRYMDSLHLPLYDGPEFEGRVTRSGEPFTGGNDRPGDLKSKDKPYIDNPDRTFLSFLNPRRVFFGLKYDF